MNQSKSSRRDFLRASTLAPLGLAARSRFAFSDEAKTKPQFLPAPKTTRRGDMVYRTLGKAA